MRGVGKGYPFSISTLTRVILLNYPLSEIKFHPLFAFSAFDLLFGGKTLTTNQVVEHGGHVSVVPLEPPTVVKQCLQNVLCLRSS